MAIMDAEQMAFLSRKGSGQKDSGAVVMVLVKTVKDCAPTTVRSDATQHDASHPSRCDALVGYTGEIGERGAYYPPSWGCAPIGWQFSRQSSGDP